MILKEIAKPAQVPRKVVLDTNVVLDLWLFDDPRVCTLADTILTGRIMLITDPGCTEELECVLRYPRFALEEGEQAAILTRYKNVARDVACSDPESKGSPAQCSDPDDQKFLNLAWRTGADLLTRDKALLVLRRRYAALGGGTICEPERLLTPIGSRIEWIQRRRPPKLTSANTDLGHNFALAPSAASPRRCNPKMPQSQEI